MTVPVSITAQVTALNSAITATGNLNTASFDALNALAWKAGRIASTIDWSIDKSAGALDTFSAPLMPQDIINGVLALSDASDTQTALSELESYVARIEINLENRA